MSLPAGQQRVLDEIGVRLRVSEPRLASMFAIFTRLNLHEPRPRREELPIRRGVWGLMAGEGRGGRARPSPLTARRGRRRSALLTLIACNIAVTLAVVGLLIGLGRSSAPCTPGHQAGTGAAPVASASCRAQGGPYGYWLGSK